MGVLDLLRRLIWRAEEASNELEYAALDAVHHAEDVVDEQTGGRFYDALEKADEETDEMLERLRREESEGDPEKA